MTWRGDDTVMGVLAKGNGDVTRALKYAVVVRHFFYVVRAAYAYLTSTGGAICQRWARRVGKWHCRQGERRKRDSDVLLVDHHCTAVGHRTLHVSSDSFEAVNRFNMALSTLKYAVR